MSSKVNVRVFQLIVGIILLSFLAGCGALTPEFTYQGKLTDENGTPLNGSFTITYKLFDALTGGNVIHTETNTVTVTDGLFESVIGPSSALGTLDPQDLTQPLYIELTINDGTVTETLEPRQHLYGAPYAFTLMPGSVISGELDTTLFGASTVKSVLTVQNPYDGDASNPALPALRVIGETGIELSSPVSGSAPGTIVSNPDSSTSEIHLFSNNDMEFHIDADDSGTSYFRFFNGTGSQLCTINESGAITCIGAKNASVEVLGEQRLLYSMESPEVWFEDFGSGTLQNGEAVVLIESLFANTVNLSDYHVFLTPLGDCNGLFIKDKSDTTFTVKELGSGTSNISFDYRIIAKRLGYEEHRLELDPGSQNFGEEN